MNQPTLFEQFGNSPQPVVVHERENNDVSQAILDANKHNFSKDCKRILELLLQGAELNNFWLIHEHYTNSPTRRFSDLKQSGIKIEKEMRKCEWSSRKEMFYWLSPEEIVRVKKEYSL